MDHVWAARREQVHDRLSELGYSGPLCFSQHIHMTPFPERFRMGSGIGKYEGNTKPKTWMADYLLPVQIGGGDENVAMRNPLLYTEGSSRA